MVVLLIGLAIALKPAYRAYRSYLVTRNLETAKTAALHSNWATARDKARSVLMVRPSDFEAFRIWNQACGKLGEPWAFIEAARFFKDPRATHNDLLEALRLMARQAPQAMTLRAFSLLPEALGKQADFCAAITPLLVRHGEGADAEKRLRAAIRPDTGPAVRLELLRTLCQRPDVWRMAEARRIFADFIAAKADEQALAALLLLGEVPRALAPGLALPDLPTWLAGQPKATAIHHLTAMTPALEARPRAADTLYQSAIDRFLASDPGVVGNWLILHGKAELAANALTDLALTRSDAYLTRLHALLLLADKTDELDDALAHPPDAVDPVEIEIVKAIHATKTSDPIAANSAWTRVLNEAASNTRRNRFIEIAPVAQLYGASNAVLDAWVAAYRLGWGQLPLFRDILPVLKDLAAKGRSEDLLTIYETLCYYEPANPDLLNNLTYLALLHGVMAPSKVITLQLKLLEQAPKRLEFNSTLMLAEMLNDRPTDALARLPQLYECKGVEPMMKLALEGCARVLAGETEAGVAILNSADWSGFMRQERVVFRDLLGKSKLTGLAIPELKIEPAVADPEQTPAWRKAIEQQQKLQSGDVLPPLPPLPTNPINTDPGKTDPGKTGP